MVIDNNPKIVQNVVNTYDVMGISGNGANYDVLIEAGAARADLLIAATSSDEVNILSCLMAKKIGTRHTIARVRNPEYARQLVFIREELGLSMVVNPEFEAAREIARILRFPSAIKIDCFSKGRVDLAEIRLPEGGHLAGHNLFKAIGMFKQKSKHVLIIGGGKIAFYLAQQMADVGVDIKIIEQNEARCLELSEKLPRATIINGDGTDRSTLLEEGLESSDACVVLTGIDEENIIVSLYAQSLGVSKVVTKIDRISFADMVESVGIDTFITPKFITANRIVRYVRAMQDSGGSAVKTLYKIVNNHVEALEFSIAQGCPYVNTPLKKLKTKKSMLIASIIRRGRVIIPGGDDHLEVGDSMIVVTTTSGYVKNLDDIFA